MKRDLWNWAEFSQIRPHWLPLPTGDDVLLPYLAVVAAVDLGLRPASAARPSHRHLPPLRGLGGHRCALTALTTHPRRATTDTASKEDAKAMALEKCVIVIGRSCAVPIQRELAKIDTFMYKGTLCAPTTLLISIGAVCVLWSFLWGILRRYSSGQLKHQQPQARQCRDPTGANPTLLTRCRVLFMPWLRKHVQDSGVQYDIKCLMPCDTRHILPEFRAFSGRQRHDST